MGIGQVMPVYFKNIKSVIADDYLPPGDKPELSWSLLSGPGAVRFINPVSPTTDVLFETGGDYVL
jgi:hypothetical protein